MQIQVTPFGGGESSIGIMEDYPYPANANQEHINTARSTSESYHVVCGENLGSEDPSARQCQISASHGDVFFTSLIV